MDAIACGIQDRALMMVSFAAFLIVFVAFVRTLNNLLAVVPLPCGAPMAQQRLARGTDFQ